MTNALHADRPEIVMDDRDLSILREIKRKIKTVADMHDVEPEKVLAVVLTSLDNQTLRYAVEDIVT